jgi:hypothetical protein
VLEARSQIEGLARDDEHLDVRELVCDATRDAAGEYHLLGHVVGERIRDALCDVPQSPRRSRHAPNLTDARSGEAPA